LTQPLPIRRRFVPKPFPPAKYFRFSTEEPVCEYCQQIIRAEKLTQSQKVRELEQSGESVTGQVILTMADGIQHHIPVSNIIALLERIKHGVELQRGVLPHWVFNRHPALGWLRACVTATSTDGSTAHQQLLNLIEEKRKAS